MKVHGMDCDCGREPHTRLGCGVTLPRIGHTPRQRDEPASVTLARKIADDVVQSACDSDPADAEDRTNTLLITVNDLRGMVAASAETIIAEEERSSLDQLLDFDVLAKVRAFLAKMREEPNTGGAHGGIRHCRCYHAIAEIVGAE